MKNRFLVVVILFVVYPSLGQSYKHFIEGEAQGTTYHITYYDSINRDYSEEIEAILEAFDQSVSTYHNTSIISKVNANDTSVVLDETFLTCFNCAKGIWRLTNGAFDPTVFPLVNAWGFGPQQKPIVEQEKLDSLLQFVGFEKIQIVNGKIVKQDTRVALDFNAFAQGYSVDVVAQFLQTKKCLNYLVEIGGELRAQGLMEEEHEWLIGIEKPTYNATANNPIFQVIAVQNEAVATSGNYRKYIEKAGEKLVHHIDPTTGAPTKNNLLSITLITNDCITADATATGLLVLGLKKSKRFLKDHDNYQAMLIYSTRKGGFKTFVTKGFESKIRKME
jgi:thiamine biosynthesis lipoprotein